MLSDPRLVKASKYLSRHLRHQPERLGLTLAPGGWVGVDELLAACAAHGFALSRAELEEVVRRNDKRRFSFDAHGARIRASQGHSVAVDLGLAPADPPETLFHGTPERSLDAILREGLRPMGRHHVHLSPDAATATRVGGRRGKAVVLEVAAGAMARAGHVFHVSDNGVWLTDAVKPDYLAVLRS
ncbi:MAG TPA: RNA 2'-phosphotransferase [Solirubrobacteraceae bacterium]|jgi:putative RNA 2'-phosphotransferase